MVKLINLFHRLYCRLVHQHLFDYGHFRYNNKWKCSECWCEFADVKADGNLIRDREEDMDGYSKSYR